MRDDNTRNTIIFVVCAVLLLIAYQVFVIDPQAKRRQAELARQAPPAAAARAGNVAAPQVPQAMTRQAAVAASPRVVIDTPALTGSLSLRGARIDDLYLDQYRQTVKKGSPAVELLRPEGAQYPWFAEIGWVGANVPGLPNANTAWTLAQGSKLAPGQPVTLTYSNGQGLTFTRQISVDERYMFSVVDTVANTTGQPVTLAHYGTVQRQGVPADLGKNQIVHEGAIGWLDGKLRQVKYGKWQKDGGGPAYTSTGGWLGITDKYWLAALSRSPWRPTARSSVRACRRPSAGTRSCTKAGSAGSRSAGTSSTASGRRTAPARPTPPPAAGSA